MGTEKTEQFYEDKYRLEEDPWDYENRAVELLRYDAIFAKVKKLKLNCSKVLDVGCSRGHLSFMFDGISKEVTGIDISETAIKNLNSLVASGENKYKTRFNFIKGSIASLPLEDNSFDLILLCDGINEWFLLEENRRGAVKEALRVIKPEGYIVFTDYQSPKNFDNYVSFIKSCGLEVVRIRYLFDRFNYQFNSWLKLFGKSGIASKILSGRRTARILSSISSIFGKAGSKHIMVVCRPK